MSGGTGGLPYAAKGAIGPAGAAGIAGKQGPQGPQGADEVAGNYVASVTKYRQIVGSAYCMFFRFTSLDGSQKDVQFGKENNNSGVFVHFT